MKNNIKIDGIAEEGGGVDLFSVDEVEGGLNQG